MICPKCKNQLPDGVKFCKFCGTQFTQSNVQSNVQRHAPKKKKSNKVVYIVVSALLVVAIVVGAFLIFGKKDESKPSEDNGSKEKVSVSTDDKKDNLEPNMIPADYKFKGKTISADMDYTIALTKDGVVVATGNTTFGKCDIAGLNNVVEVETGYRHSVALKYDGSVVAIGDNEKGQCEVSGWTDIVTISAEDWYTYGLKKDGTVVVTQGFGEFAHKRDDVLGWTDIVAISSGEDYTVGLKSDGTVVTVGDNRYGQCNVSDWTNIIAIATGCTHTVGLKADGTVVSTKIEEKTTLRDGSQVVEYIDTMSSNYGQTDVSGWTDIVAISVGRYHTVGLKSDGTVVATTFDDRYTEYVENGKEIYIGTDCYTGQCDVSGWTDIVAISAGAYHTVALKSDGTVISTNPSNYYNGINDEGQWKVQEFKNIAIPQK